MGRTEVKKKDGNSEYVDSFEVKGNVVETSVSYRGRTTKKTIPLANIEEIVD